MKIIACYKVLNESDYLNQSIEAIYSYVDKIVVVEGCLAGMVRILRPDRVSAEGLSCDGTTELIANYPDDDEKIIHDKVGFLRNEVQMINRFLQYVDVGDYIWMIDGDEIYSNDAIIKLTELMQFGRYDVLKIPAYTLWYDFHHRLVGGKWDIAQPRIIKKTADSLQCQRINAFVTGDGVNLVADSRRVLNCADIPVFYFHFAYVRSVQRILENIMWQKLEVDYANNTNVWGYLRQFPTLVEAILKVEPFFTNKLDPRRAVRPVSFELPLPSSVQNHEFATRQWNELPIKVDKHHAKSLVTDVEFGYKPVGGESVVLPSDFSLGSYGTVEVSRQGGIGDLVLLLPSLKEFRKQCRVVLKVPSYQIDFAKAVDAADEVISFNDDVPSDWVINLTKAPEASLDRFHKSRVEIFADLCGVMLNDPIPKFDLGGKKGVSENPLVGFCLRSTHRLRDWHLDYYRELALMLQEEGIEIALLDHEANYGGQIIETNYDMRGRFNLLELATFIGGLDALVTPDTGPLHLAGAQDVPTVAIFGSTDPELVSPYPSVKVLTSWLPCMPCWETECNHFSCMKRVTPQMVFDEVIKLVSR